MPDFPIVRMRRFRQTAALRSLTGTNFPRPARFAWPIFLIEGENKILPIQSLPGQYYYTVDRTASAIRDVFESGVRTFLIFGMVDKDKKDDKGTYSFNDDGLVQESLRFLCNEFPDATLIADTGLSGYTNHGHAGILNDHGEVDNDLTLDVLSQVALSQADAGATCVAPSGMMDGQVKHLRAALDESGFKNVLIMSYASKFHSQLYGAFPYAVEAPREADPRTQTYLVPPHDLNQALREAILDAEEGADILLVKPALFYLDAIQTIRASINIPLAAYNVSGEYAMIHAAAKTGYYDLYKLAYESLLSIHRAGADIIISYWANQLNHILKGHTL